MIMGKEIQKDLDRDPLNGDTYKVCVGPPKSMAPEEVGAGKHSFTYKKPQ